MTQAVASTKPRAAFLDHIRVALTVLVMWHHSAIMFGGPGGWYVRNPVDGTLTKVLFTLMCSVDQAFFMGAFFLLSGYFTPRALDRKGLGSFAADRLLRLGVPLVVYGFLIGPMTVALAAHVRGAPFWSTWLRFLAEPRFEIGPLWFAFALLLFNAGYVLWRWARRGPSSAVASDAPATGVLTHGRLAAAAIVTAAVAFALRLGMPVGTQWWGLQIGYFSSYVVLFGAGCWLARSGELEHIDARLAKPWGRLSLLAIPSLFIYAVAQGALRGVPFESNGGWTLPALAYALWEPLVAWGIILMLLWRLRMRTHVAPWWNTVAPCAYAAYIVHPPFLVLFAWALEGVAVPNLAKFVLTAIAAPLLIFAVAAGLVRLPGARKVL
jgi:peptidoglycan/LPS O-acetylase OafA/YrhL